MSNLEEVWNFVKSGLEVVSKIFNAVYEGVKFIVECISSINIIAKKNSWVETFTKALPYIFDLLYFLKNNGINIDVNSHKSQLKDMNLDNCSDHNFELKKEREN